MVIGDKWIGGGSEAVSPDSLGELQVPAHYSDSPGMDGAKISILEQRDQVCLCGFLQCQYCLALEPNLLLEISGNIPHQSLEGQFTDEKLGLGRD